MDLCWPLSLPTRPRPDVTPVASALRRWWQLDPDLYTLACCGIQEICSKVRNWMPRPPVEGLVWRARYLYLGLIFEFAYGWIGQLERLVFIRISGGDPGLPSVLSIRLTSAAVLPEITGHDLAARSTAPVRRRHRFSERVSCVVSPFRSRIMHWFRHMVRSLASRQACTVSAASDCDESDRSLSPAAVALIGATSAAVRGRGRDDVKNRRRHPAGIDG